MRVKTKPVGHGKSLERGSTLVEFTLTLLPLLALLMLTVDAAWAIFAWASIQEGVREGVRYAITCQSDANIQDIVRRYSFGFISSQNAGAVVSVRYYSPTNPSQELLGRNTNSPGNVVKVTVSGVSILPMVPIWRSSTPLNIGASLADIVEPNPFCTAHF